MAAIDGSHNRKEDRLVWTTAAKEFNKELEPTCTPNSDTDGSSLKGVHILRPTAACGGRCKCQRRAQPTSRFGGPGDGNWYVLGGQNSQQVTVSWGGQSGDKTVPGDYDGDGKTDFSIYRPANPPTTTVATWYILTSSTGDSQYLAPEWATANDVPVAGDFDGDGKTDLAAYRTTTGHWYIYRSSDQQTIDATWGNSGDVPAPADYDGDGKTDIAVWRSSDQTFYSINSSDGGYKVGSMGHSGAIVSGDYYGDGKADFALFDTSANTGLSPWQKLMTQDAKP